MKVAVVIPTLGRTFFVLNMVMLLQEGGRKPDEIIIVDQNDPASRNPFAFAKLREYERRGLCHIIEHPVKSLTIARNIGARASDSDLLVYVDDDSFVPPDFLEHYVELFQDPELDAATGMVLVREGDTGTIDTSRIHPSQYDGHTMVRGSNFAIRRSVMHRIGGMDENMVGAANWEDVDLSFRLHQHGCKVVWAPKPWGFHLAHHEGGGRARNPRANLNLAYNLFYFHLRHRRLDASAFTRILRWCVVNRQSLARPWQLPPRMLEFIRGYRMASARARQGPALPLEAIGP